jgi:hypothetical protein
VIPDRLRKDLGISPELWKKVGGKVMSAVRPWYEEESKRREAEGKPLPTIDELLAEASRILVELGIIPDPGPAGPAVVVKRLMAMDVLNGPPMIGFSAAPEAHGSRLIWGIVEPPVV